jgi:PD-(D/E)XK nuclease superfamily
VDDGRLAMNEIRISASKLAGVAVADFCERCYWLRLHLSHKLPFESFPSIFTEIASYTKDIVHSWLVVHGMPPTWLSNLGRVVYSCEPPHWSKFQTVDEIYDIRLTGEADAIFQCADGSYVIVDYKTVRFNDEEDRKLRPRYKLQLNTYARIAADRGFAPISHLALVYMEPAASGDAINDCENCREDGFVMAFRARVEPVQLDDGLLANAMARTREIFELTHAPDDNPRCDNCKRVVHLMEQLWPGISDEINHGDFIERCRLTICEVQGSGVVD